MKTKKTFFIRNFKFEYRITLSYLIFGFIWILFSDELLDFMTLDHRLLTKFQTYKGVFFVFITSVFLYFFVKKHMQSLRNTELRLIDSENHYKALFYNNHSVILLINPDNGEIEDANPAACKFYHWTHPELCSKSVFDLNPIDKELVKERLRAVNKEMRNHFIARHQLADGTLRDVEIFSNPIRIEDKIMIYSSVHDITEQIKAETELRILSKAVEQSPVAICITNPEGKIEYVNPRAIELTGYSISELINAHTKIFSSGEKPKEDYEDLWQKINSGKIWTGEFHNKKKDGELYWESATISPVFDTTGLITHFLSIKEDITDRKQAEMALNKSEKLLRKFASHLQNVREEEKVALAREIHDELGQTLVALKIDTGLLKSRLTKSHSPEDMLFILDSFDEIVSLIDTTIKTTRRIMSGLRPELLEMNGFVNVATTYIGEFEERHQISCDFFSEISSIEMNSQQSLVFFRILQESLSNIAKHSKATSVKIIFKIEDNKLILEIIDNGIGFNKHNSGRQDSYGMIGMNERAVLLNGELEITSELGKGTSVKVEIPWVSK